MQIGRTMPRTKILALALVLAACDGEAQEDTGPDETPVGDSGPGSESGESSSDGSSSDDESSTGAELVCALDLSGDACADIVAMIDAGACDQAANFDCVAGLGRLIDAELATVEAANSAWGNCDTADAACIAASCSEATICHDCDEPSACQLGAMDYASCVAAAQCVGDDFCFEVDASTIDIMCTALVQALG